MRRSRVSQAGVAVIAIGVAAVFLMLGAAPVLAAQPGVPATFGSTGTQAGQLEEPRGIAIDQSPGIDGQNGNVYIMDHNNSRVDEFTGDGEFVRAWGWDVDLSKPEEHLQECTIATGCKQGTGGSGPGQLGSAEGIAVSSSAGLSHVFVVDSSNARVEKYSATGQFELMFGGEVNATKDANPTATAAEKDVCTQREIETEHVECKAGVEGEENGEVSKPTENAIAAYNTATGSQIYVGDANRVQRFSEDGVYEATVLDGIGSVIGISVGAAGEIYVRSGSQNGVHAYTANGTELPPVRDETGTPASLTSDANGDLFVDDRSSEHHIFEYNAGGAQVASFDKGPYSEDGEFGLAFGEAAEALYLINLYFVGSTRATDVRTVTLPAPGPFVAKVSAAPRALGVADVEAEINPEGATTEYFVEYGPGGSLPPFSGRTVSQQLSASFEESPVSLQLSGLGFSTEYDYCLVAVNAKGRTPCVPKTFVSSPATDIISEWTSDVADTSATFNAEVDPERNATSCSFEYGLASSGVMEHVVAASEITVPEEAPVRVAAHAQEGIAPASEYHYRLVCVKGTERNVGPVKSFESQAGSQAGVSLPDDRVLERVAGEGNGAGLDPPQYAGFPEAAESGGALAYLRLASNSSGAEANRAPEPAVDIARHLSTGGWSSKDITNAYSSSHPPALGNGTEYRLFNPDLGSAIVEPRNVATPYERVEEETASSVFGAVKDQPLFTEANVVGKPELEPSAPEPYIRGGNANLSAVVLKSLVPLRGASESVSGSLYEWSAGALSAISILPKNEGGLPVSGSLGGPTAQDDARDAVSPDGMLVDWTGEPGLYVRDVQTRETLRLDVPEAGVVPQSGETAEPDFQIASVNGLRVFFTDTQRLTTDATAVAGEPDLYECVISTSPDLGCHLVDLTAKTQAAGEAADVLGLIGAASENGDRLYFTATGVLAEDAEAGQPNLYTVVEEDGVWKVSLIATLVDADSQDWNAGRASGVDGLGELTERASGDGRYFAFMSQAELAGYDNHDAVTGLPDEEAYLYDAQTGRLSCLSCDPTGARPHSIFVEGPALVAELTKPVEVEGVWAGHWLAGILPAWKNMKAGGASPTSYQPRSVSDSGRVFFESATALSPGAGDGTVGVYEFEPAGVGSCRLGSSGYAAGTGGCVMLLSPGTSTYDSVFLDASANGDDVFFMSTAGSPEGSSLYSIYDAHSCEPGTSWACASGSSAVARQVCENAQECKEGGSTGALTPGGLASSTLSGSGNKTASVASGGGKAQARKGGKAGGCEARARRLKGAKKRKRALARCRASGKKKRSGSGRTGRVKRRVRA